MVDDASYRYSTISGKQMSDDLSNKSCNTLEGVNLDKKRQDRLERLRLWKLKKQQEKPQPGFVSIDIPKAQAEFAPNKQVQPAKKRAVVNFGRAKQSSYAPSNQVKSNGESLPTSSNPKDKEDGTDPLEDFMNLLEAEVDEPQQDAIQAVPIENDDETSGPYDPAEEDGSISSDKYRALLNKKKKKEIPNVDHSQVNYEPFVKCLYREVEEVSSMGEMEVDDMRLDMDGICVKGNDVPKPVSKWEQLGFHLNVLNSIRALGFTTPTPIQAQAMPCILSGRDVVGVAKTGSGKTLAFVLPMIRHIKDQRPLSANEGPIGLILSPTRELAMQIHRVCKLFGKSLNLRATCAYGGAPIKDQIAELRRGSEMLVCTPGRIIDLLAANGGRVLNLQRVTYLVLDEADRMFDMGFEPQVAKILANIRPDRQTILFSATFPRHMERLAKTTLKDPVEVVVGMRNVVAKEVTQHVLVMPESQKFHQLLDILGKFYMKDDPGRAIVFVERQEAADDLLKLLLPRGYACQAIHGGKDQLDRDSAIRSFKNGDIPLLIATSVAARGLDVKELRLVVNYDAPNHMEDYVHRVGRTGRAGNEGFAWTFVTPEQTRAAYDISKALRLSKVNVPNELRELADEYWKQVKQGGKTKFSNGFGGKGLDRLDEERLLARTIEKRAYNVLDEDNNNDDGDEENDKDDNGHKRKLQKPNDSSGTSKKPEAEYEVPAPVISRTQDETRSATKRYFTQLTINDFPMTARLKAVGSANMSRVRSETKAQLTVKGEYRPPGASTTDSSPPPLYILIEGDTELQVRNGYYALASELVGGTNSAAISEMQGPRTGRYSVV